MYGAAIWRLGLKPIPLMGKLCVSETKAFPVSLTKIAKENCFYGVKELSQQERDIIYGMTVQNSKDVQRDIHESWLNLYCAPFDMVDAMTSLGYSILGHTDRVEIENEQELRIGILNMLKKSTLRLKEQHCHTYHCFDKIA